MVHANSFAYCLYTNVPHVQIENMISNLIINADEGTSKPSMLIEDDCEVRMILDAHVDTSLLLIFETLDERAVIALEVPTGKRQEACDILANAFERIGELADEDE